MPHLSRNQVDDKVWNQVWGKLVMVVTKIEAEQEAVICLRGLLTETERKMLSKRLMIGILLTSNWPPRVICNLLKLSRSTILKYQGYLERDQEYVKFLTDTFGILKYQPEKIHEQTLIDDLVSLLDAIMVGYNQRSRLHYFQGAR
jgi:Trp operon repressor